MALKIKDNVDLKELGKFGFYQSNKLMNSWEYDLKIKEPKEKHCFANKEWASLSVREFETDGKTKTNKELLLIVLVDDECWYELDGIIFDLIQAGLVEKVEEKNGR